ncbi:MAG: hypothetical protein HFF18_01085 [Oscillospiraceae bacterium]|nr:hypothetical protein [Oscillospiraceae bacterium]
MAKRKSKHHQGHYCKICGEYKANEKFSGKGHVAHICKACSSLSAGEKAEAMTINRLMNLPFGRLSDRGKGWLENRVHDHRPKVAELAREVYRQHLPYAERNKRKKQLVINTLTFEIHTEVFDEYGDELPANVRFTADRISHVLTMTDFNADGVVQSLTLDGKKISTLLRWVVHSLEIFMWEEDYRLAPDGSDLFFETSPEDWDDDFEDFTADEVPAPKPGEDICWKVQIEYTDHTSQEIVSYQDYLSDRPEELYLALLEYFEPEMVDSDEE